jgi:hypothetical protein
MKSKSLQRGALFGATLLLTVGMLLISGATASASPPNSSTGTASPLTAGNGCKTIKTGQICVTFLTTTTATYTVEGTYEKTTSGTITGHLTIRSSLTQCPSTTALTSSPTEKWGIDTTRSWTYGPTAVTTEWTVRFWKGPKTGPWTTMGYICRTF